MRLLVVNADDLGYDPEIDRGILEAHERGIVSSATAMVGTAHSRAALRAAPSTLGVGLHAVLEPAWDGARVEAAVREQLARFEELRGVPPTHLDGHKHLHLAGAALAAVARVAAERALPVRSIDAGSREALRRAGVRTPDRFLGDASARPAWTPASLAAAVGGLEEGVSELMAHPGYRPSVARTSFGVEREEELRALCDPGVRRALEARGARLVDYRAVAGPPSPGTLWTAPPGR